MKAQTIEEIHRMLKLRVRDAQYQYKTRRYNLEEKYKTEWLDNVVSEQEKRQLDSDREYLCESRKLLEDFENYQW